MILLTYCMLLVAYQGEPSTFLYLMSIAEWQVEVWLGVRWALERAK